MNLNNLNYNEYIIFNIILNNSYFTNTKIILLRYI